jgi:uncharacterized protein YkuJ
MFVLKNKFNKKKNNYKLYVVSTKHAKAFDSIQYVVILYKRYYILKYKQF